MSNNFDALLIDLFADEGQARRDVLAGADVLVLPVGAYHRYGVTRDVTAAAVQEFAANFEQRANRGIRRQRVAVDVDHEGGAVGWYENVVATPQGLAASFSWNERGQKLLTGDEYAYFSPTIAWEQEDRVTGNIICNQVIGGALTNYPFFGEETALYAIERGLWCGADLEQNGGYGMSDNITNEAVEGGLRQFFSSLFTQSEEPKPKLATITAEQLAEFDINFTALQEKVTGFSTQVQQLTGERDAYAARVTALEGNLSTVQDLWAIERFAAQAESFSNLPVKTGDLAAELRWLNGADTVENQPHVAFFNTLLAVANSEYAARFATIGGRGVPAPDSTLAMIEQEVEKYQAENEGVGDDAALRAVLKANPNWYSEYRQEVI